jgi:hypothetical protein
MRLRRSWVGGGGRWDRPKSDPVKRLYLQRIGGKRKCCGSGQGVGQLEKGEQVAQVEAWELGREMMRTW